MDEVQAAVSIIETLGMIGLMLLWLRDKNDTLNKERQSRRDLSDDILEDWKQLKQSRTQQKSGE